MGNVEYVKLFFMIFIIFALLVPSFNAQSVVTIDSKNRLIVDGKPFFPNGIYMSPEYTTHGLPNTDMHLERVRDAGFNFVIPVFQPNGTAIMEHGLKSVHASGYPCSVITFTEHRYALSNCCYSWDKYFTAKPKSLTEWMNSSSLIGWYNADEPNIKNAKNETCSRFQTISKHDPNRPCITVLYGPYSLSGIPYIYNGFNAEPFMNCTDVVGFTDYAVGHTDPNLPIKSVYTITRAYHNLTKNKKPVWAVLQLCRLVPEKKPRKEVSLSELRLESYLALIANANGLIWWSYPDIYNKFTSQDIKSSTPEQRWLNASIMAKEVQFMSPMLLEGIDSDLSASNESLLTRGLSYKGDMYILVANPDPKAQHVVTVKPNMGNMRLSDLHTKYGNLQVSMYPENHLLQIKAPAYESGLIIISPKSSESYVFTVGGEAFYPAHSVDYSNSYGEGGAYIVTGNGALVTPVHLPQGAILDKFKVFFYNDTTGSHASKIDVWLEGLSLKHGSSYILSELDSQGISGYGNKTASIAVQTPIDNSVWGYDIRAWSDSWQGDNLRIMGAVITYNIPPE